MVLPLDDLEKFQLPITAMYLQIETEPKSTDTNISKVFNHQNSCDIHFISQV